MKSNNLLTLLLLLLGLSSATMAQTTTPEGGDLSIFFDCGDHGFGVDKKGVNVVPDLMNDQPNNERVELVGDDDDILCASVKDKTDNNTILILTTKGKVFQVTNNLLAPPSVGQLASINNLHQFGYIVGDDMYITAFGMLYVTRDAGLTWIPDTLGLDINAFQAISGIDLDTAQNVWLTTQGNLFMQPLISSTWTQVTNYPENDASYVFGDRTGRVWVSGYNAGNSHMTDNYGSTWSAFPTGLPAYRVISMADDIYGNIYVVLTSTNGNGDMVYKSVGGTQAFTRIDLPIQPLIALNDEKNIYIAVSADTNITLTTKVGLLRSKDGGVTWQELNIRQTNVISSIEGHSNNVLMATEKGIFSKPNGSNVWTKKFPTNGFISNQKIFKDANGNLYSFAHLIYNSDEQYPINMVYKSTDGGNTWLPDTLGIHNVITEEFGVAGNGQQLAAGSIYFAGQGNVYFVWKKDAGQSWVMDTLGLPLISQSTFVSSFGRDDAGNVYVVVRGLGTSAIYKRPATGGAWVFDANIFANVYSISGKNGKVIAASDGGLLYKTTGTWQSASLPAGIVPGPLGITSSAAQITDNGVVWLYLENYSNDYGSYGEGVWYSTNFTTWYEPDNQVDTTIFSDLYAVGDSVFGVTVNGVVYVFDTVGTGTGIGIKDIAGNNSLSIYPNPANDVAHVQVSMEKGDKVSLQVAALDGNSILVIDNVQTSAGNNIVINTRDIAPGIYICKISVNGRLYTSKLSVFH